MPLPACLQGMLWAHIQVHCPRRASQPARMLPAQGGGPAQLRQSRGVEVPRIPFTPRVPLKVLQQMLVGYDTVRAERLLSGFAYEFYSDALVWTAQHIICFLDYFYHQ